MPAYQVTAVFDGGVESFLGYSNFGRQTGCTAFAQNPVQISKTDHGFENGDIIYAANFTEMTELNHRYFQVTNKSDDFFQLSGEDGSSYSAEVTGGQFSKCSVSTENTPEEDNPVRVAWATLPDAVSYKVYKEHNGIFGFIAETIETQFIDKALIEPDIGHIPPNGVGFKSTLEKSPSASGYYQQRRIIGGSSNAPDTWAASKIGFQNLFEQIGDTQADGPIEATLQSDRINNIEHFISGRDLIILTSSSEWQVDAGNANRFSADTVNQKPQSQIGASSVKPIHADSSVIFERTDGGAIYEIQYSIESDGYKARELSLLSRHLFKDNKVRDMAYVLNPDNLILCVMEDGTVNVMSYYPNQEVLAWTHWDTEGEFESVTSIVNPDTGEDEIYFVVKRRVLNSNRDEVSTRYIERLKPRDFENLEDAFFVDCGVSYNGPAADVDSISGAWHLVGHTHAVILSDNRMEDDNVAFAYSGVAIDSNGVVDTGFTSHPAQDPYNVTKLHIGLPYTSRVQTLNPERTQSTLQGERKKISEVGVKLYNTGIQNLTWGLKEAARYAVRKDIRDNDGELVTRDYQHSIPSSWDEDGSLIIEQTLPLPLTILGITPDIEIND